MNYLNKFFNKSTLDTVKNKKLKGLWITNIQLYPSLHGCSVYTRFITKELCKHSDLDLLYYIDNDVYEKNPRLHLAHLKNIYYVEKLKNINKPLLKDGLNNYSNIVQKKLVDWIQKKFKTQKYDFVVCDYVYLSKIFDFIPNNVVKVINTHDHYGDRHIGLNWDDEQRKKAFCITSQDEIELIKKSDVILTISNTEKKLFENKISKEKLHIPVKCIRFRSEKLSSVSLKKDLKRTTKKNLKLKLGFIGSSNPINTSGLIEYIEELNKLKPKNIELIIAGLISDKISHNYKWIKKLGKVTDKGLEDFYNSVNVIINPMPKETTGLKIKTIESLLNDVPIIGTVDAFTGINSKSIWHNLESIKELASQTIYLSDNLKNVSKIERDCKNVKNEFIAESNNEIEDFYNCLNSRSYKKNKNMQKNNESFYKIRDLALDFINLDDFYLNQFGPLNERSIKLNKYNNFLLNKISRLESAIKPNYVGFVNIFSSFGLFQDNWCEKDAGFNAICKKQIKDIHFYIDNPLNHRGDFVIVINKEKFTFKLKDGPIICKIKYPCKKDKKLNIKLSSSSSGKVVGDARDLSFVLSEVVFK